MNRSTHTATYITVALAPAPRSSEHHDIVGTLWSDPFLFVLHPGTVRNYHGPDTPVNKVMPTVTPIIVVARCQFTQ